MWIIFKKRFYPCLISAIKDEMDADGHMTYCYILSPFMVALLIVGTETIWSEMESIFVLRFFYIVLCMFVVVIYCISAKKVLRRTRVKMEVRVHESHEEAPRTDVSMPVRYSSLQQDYDDPEYRLAKEETKSKSVSPIAKLKELQSIDDLKDNFSSDAKYDVRSTCDPSRSGQQRSMEELKSTSPSDDEKYDDVRSPHTIRHPLISGQQQSTEELENTSSSDDVRSTYISLHPSRSGQQRSMEELKSASPSDEEKYDDVRSMHRSRHPSRHGEQSSSALIVTQAEVYTFYSDSSD